MSRAKLCEISGYSMQFYPIAEGNGGQHVNKVEQNGQYINEVSVSQEKFAFYFTHRKTQLLFGQFNDVQDWQNLLKNIYIYQQHLPALEEYFPHLEIVTYN
ncbi:hypothetical protein WN51_03606 [Melipona quadrifasciata]|uniref:Uncharacterized protein n=1 Tax=Melipona quadrifasciata TaxID=166423 RepID=A0A0M8ZTX2_9HYME|nr:hypothetical protein WN51_03606 [Melipona quadrifasciata]